MALQILRPIKAEEYYKFAIDKGNYLTELVDGMMMIGDRVKTPSHQSIVGAAFFLLMQFTKQHGGKTYLSPIDVCLDEYNVYHPQVVYLTPNSPCTVEISRLSGAPDLVFETTPGIFVEGSSKKFKVYQAQGVKEYWAAN